MRISGKILHIFLRIMLGTIVLSGIALLGIGFFLRQNPHALAEKLADTIRTRAGIECSMGLVDVAMLPIPALAVADIRIHTDTIDLTVAYATMRPSLRALLRGEFEPGDITLLRPDLRLKKAPEAAAVSTPLVPPVGFRIPDMIQNSRLIIQHGSLDMPDVQGRRITMQDIRTDISPSNADSVHGWVHVGTATVYDGTSVAAHISALQIDMNGAILAMHQGAQGRVRVQGQASLPDLLYLDSVDIGIEQGNSKGQPAPLLIAKVQGSFPFEGHSIPFHMEGTGKDTWQGPIHIDNLELGLDKDRLRLQGTMLLPQGDKLWPTLAGTLTIHRLSLPQWFGFGRPMPGGLQHTLDALSGTLDFELDAKGLKVPHLQVQTAGTTFTGTGSVASWAKPLIAISARAHQLTLEKALPEAVGKFPLAPVYPHTPLTPEPGSTAAADLNIPTINYDIQLEVDSLQYGPLQMQKVQYRCIPDAPGTVDMRFGVGALYGGSADGAMLLTTGTAGKNTQYSIRAQLKNVDSPKPLQALTGSKWLGGRLSATAQWQAEGKNLPQFFATLNGISSLKVEDGFYTSPSGKGATDAFAFSRLELSNRLRGQTDPSPAKTTSTDLWTVDGEWQGQLHTKNWQGSVRLDGPLSLHRKNGLPLTFQKVPGSFSVQLNKELTNLPQDVKAHAAGRFSFHSSSGAFDAEDATINAEGLELRGSLQSNLKELRVKGDIQLKTRQLRRTLALFGHKLEGMPVKALQEVDGQARMTLEPNSLSLHNIKATIDNSHVAGSLEGQWQGRPQWKFDLNADSFDLAHYRSPAPKNSTPSTAAWNLKTLQGTDLQGTLRLNSAKLFAVHLQNMHIPVRLQSGTLECTPLKAQTYTGPVSGSFHAESKKGLKVQLDIQAIKVDMLGLTIDQQLSTVLGGQAVFNSSTSGTLRSDADIPAALNGTYGLEILNGYYQSRSPTGQLGNKSTFNFVRASGQMTNGVLLNNDLVMSGNNVRVNGKGEINFVTRQLDYTALVNLKNIAEFPIRYTGSLSNPQRNVQAGKAIVDTLGQLGSDVLGIVGDVLSTPFKLLR